VAQANPNRNDLDPRSLARCPHSTRRRYKADRRGGNPSKPFLDLPDRTTATPEHLECQCEDVLELEVICCGTFLDSKMTGEDSPCWPIGEDFALNSLQLEASTTSNLHPLPAVALSLCWDGDQISEKQRFLPQWGHDAWQRRR
jgi:hypothetical protein